MATQRGVEGGYWLARPADQITLAEVMRALEGPLANVRGHRPETLVYEGSAKSLVELWIAVRASLRTVLETTTVADLANGQLPAEVKALTADPEAWELRTSRTSRACGAARRHRAEPGTQGTDRSLVIGSPWSRRAEALGAARPNGTRHGCHLADECRPQEGQVVNARCATWHGEDGVWPPGPSSHSNRRPTLIFRSILIRWGRAS